VGWNVGTWSGGNGGGGGGMLEHVGRDRAVTTLQPGKMHLDAGKQQSTRSPATLGAG
jgi:hypothetical protein